MKTQLTIVFASIGLATAVLAAPETFDFKDPKGINNAGFKLDAPLESINGSASGVSGTVTFDPENPGATTGKIVVAANTLDLAEHHAAGPHARRPMDGRGQVSGNQLSKQKELKNVKTEGDVTTADAVGTFTCKGVSRDMTIPVKLTYLKDKLGQRVPNMKGDLLVIRSNFSIKRSDFNINPSQIEDKVSDEIQLTLSIAGASPQ